MYFSYHQFFPNRAPIKEEARARVEREYVEDQIQEAANDIRVEFEYEANMMERWIHTCLNMSTSCNFYLSSLEIETQVAAGS